MCVADGHGNGLVAGEFLYSAEIDGWRQLDAAQRVRPAHLVQANSVAASTHFFAGSMPSIL